MFWHVFIIVILILFIAILIYRIIVIKRLPVHLRWEIMPVPHEKGRADYGGSYLEEFEWWRQHRKKSLLLPLKYMILEIFLLRTIWKNNKRLWPLSFAFHIGIYLVILTALLCVISGIFGSPPSGLINALSVISLAGYMLGGLGVIALFLWRIIDIDLRSFNSVPTYLNLVFLMTVFLTGIIAWIISPNYSAALSNFSRELITFNSGIDITSSLSTHIIFAMLFLFYLPWTGMVHFITKYFTYHAVRWDDRPLNEIITEEINSLMNQPVGWSSSHTKTDK